MKIANHLLILFLCGHFVEIRAIKYAQTPRAEKTVSGDQQKESAPGDEKLLKEFNKGLFTNLKQLADANFVDSSGNSALIYAVKWNSLSAAQKFVEKMGVDVNIKNKAGKSALTFAKEQKNKVMIDYLKKNNAEDPDEELLKEFEEGDFSHLDKLIDVNIGGGQAIMLAVQSNNLTAVKKLIDKKIVFTQKMKDEAIKQARGMDLAEEGEYKGKMGPMIDFLKSKGAVEYEEGEYGKYGEYKALQEQKVQSEPSGDSGLLNN